MTQSVSFLKVPKCEIFDRSDFHGFYTIKPFWVGDFEAIGQYYALSRTIVGRARIKASNGRPAELDNL
jgi:hypothetical protein